MRTFKICANLENRVNREILEIGEQSEFFAYFAV
jgi:hypothetical protein